MTYQIKRNEIDNLDTLSQKLQQHRRLQIPNFFTQKTASYLSQLLVKNNDWYLAYNDGNSFYESSAEQVNALTPIQKQKFMNGIYRRAEDQFQYVFNQYYITQAIKLNEQPGHPMHQMHEYMNSKETLDFMRVLTGEIAITKADSYASQYLPGHFLTDHDDRHDKHDRVAAYVFSMNKKWDKNWGGHTAFFDVNGNIDAAFIPSYNTLNIFLIPQSHSVQIVSPFATEKRHSYLGWLHR